jgi:transcriptional regulator with XRE-family HTH domain
MKSYYTPHELIETLGENIKTLRLQKNRDRQSLCGEAGVSETALRNLEGGKGATLNTFIRIVKALHKTDWLNSIAPQTSINPLHLIKNKPRQRASKTKHGKNKNRKSL